MGRIEAFAVGILWWSMWSIMQKQDATKAVRDAEVYNGDNQNDN